MTPRTIDRTIDRTIGGLFLGAFLLYGIGSTLTLKGQIQPGVALMLANSLAVASIGFLARSVLAGDEPAVARSYLITRIAEAVFLGAGALFLLRDPEGGAVINAALYHAGMVILGLGSLPFCRALIWRRLVPAALGWLGLFGYAVFAAGMVADAAGYSTAGMVMLVPGAAFEVIFGLWLIFRGFSRT